MLRWTDVDFARQEVRIGQSLGSTGDVTLPKNGRPRKVTLPPLARDALMEMPRRADSQYVFTTRTGKRFSKTSHYYYWHAVRSACGRPGMDFYELRHFCATELLRSRREPRGRRGAARPHRWRRASHEHLRSPVRGRSPRAAAAGVRAGRSAASGG
jgi:integrase